MDLACATTIDQLKCATADELACATDSRTVAQRAAAIVAADHRRRVAVVMRDGLIDIAQRCDGQYPSDIARPLVDHILDEVDAIEREAL